MTARTRRRWAEAGLAANTVVWGATFVIVKSALADVSPLVFLALRFAVATLCLLVIWRPGGKSDFRDWGGGVLVGTFLFGGYVLQTMGLQYTTPAKSAFLTGLASVMVPLLAALVYKNRPLVSELLGILIATTGLGLMTLEGPIGSVGRGDLLTVLCAIAFAAHIVTLGHFSERMSFETLSVTQVATAAVWAGSLFWWVEPHHLIWRPAVVYAVLVTGLLATAGAFSVQAWAQQYTTATRTALIYTLEPVFALLTSYLLVGEGLSRRAAAGAALILGGVVMVELKPLGARQHPPR
jgi:drug/metabolite transporter (DMT)-like permease